MSHLSTQVPTRGGGRTSSPAFRHSLQLSESFPGLPRGTGRYDLLLLVKRAGKLAGFSPKMIQLLDYYMAFTKEQDWEEGTPVVYQCLARTALDLGVTERHVQRLEQGLLQAGALTWNDSGNHRRYGKRCPKTGAILFAFGVDLSPLAALQPKLQALLEEKKLRDTAWLESKRQVSVLRSRINGLLAELQQQPEQRSVNLELQLAYERLCVPIRTYLRLEKLRELLREHQALYAQLLALIEPDRTPEGGGGAEVRSRKSGDGRQEKESPVDDEKVVPKESTQQESFNELNRRRNASCFQERRSLPPARAPRPVVRPEPEEGADPSSHLPHLTLKQVLNAASPEFRAHLPLEPRPLNWSDLVEAAYRRKGELRISQENWADACQALGRNGAALCLLLTDQATLRERNPVRKPGAYFRAMIRRAGTGELDLRRSIFGLLKRDEG